MSIPVFQIGDKVRLSAAFTDFDDAAQDPGGVEFSILEPDGEVTEYTYGGGEIIRDSLGNFHVDFLITQSGRHWYRFAGITSGQAADEREFRVQKSKFE